MPTSKDVIKDGQSPGAGVARPAACGAPCQRTVRGGAALRKCSTIARSVVVTMRFHA